MKDQNVNVIHITIPVRDFIVLEKKAKEEGMSLQELMNAILKECAKGSVPQRLGKRKKV